MERALKTASDAPVRLLPSSEAVAAHDVRVVGLSKRFGDGGEVLKDVAFSAAPGEAVALIGPNGAGKSTLMRCLVRLVEPDDGEIVLLDRDVRSLKPKALRTLRSEVGFVFQKHNLSPRLSALSNVIHGALGRRRSARLWLQSLAPAAIRAEAMACLADVGLADFALRRADRLSGGQSQRVAIARALMQTPRLFLADEPAASLDPAAGEDMMALFVGLVREKKATFVFTSHNLEHALRYADRIVALDRGRIVLDAPAGRLSLGELRALYE